MYDLERIQQLMDAITWHDSEAGRLTEKGREQVQEMGLRPWQYTRLDMALTAADSGAAPELSGRFEALLSGLPVAMSIEISGIVYDLQERAAAVGYRAGFEDGQILAGGALTPAHASL